jgi:hypothetical protein
MGLREQNLLTRALAAAPAFEIPSLRSLALRQTMVPLLETVENRFPEHLAVTLLRCVRCQKCQQMFVPSEHFF